MANGERHATCLSHRCRARSVRRERASPVECGDTTDRPTRYRPVVAVTTDGRSIIGLPQADRPTDTCQRWCRESVTDDGRYRSGKIQRLDVKARDGEGRNDGRREGKHGAALRRSLVAESSVRRGEGTSPNRNLCMLLLLCRILCSAARDFCICSCGVLVVASPSSSYLRK